MKSLLKRVRKGIYLLIIVTLLIPMLPQIKVSGATGPFLHPLFSNNMVLQRDVENTIWGWTTSGDKVLVEIDGMKFNATVGSGGKWVAKISPFPKGGPYQIKITGAESVALNDVYFGEVWICSGQSNMGMQLPFIANGDQEVANSANKNIRFFTTPFGSSANSQENFGYGGSWQVSGPQTVGNLSAAAYFFAKGLNAALDVPVGIINSSVGGTQIESWISNDALKNFVATANVSGYTPPSPNVYYNGMISPLIPVAAKGVLWYQGESNTQFDYLYEKQLNTLITDWRKNFGQDMAFVVIQLPNYLTLQKDPVENAPWATIREGQLASAMKMKDVGIVTTIDIGEAEDIHPKNKQDLGKRAALCALGRFYNHNIEYCGPIYKSMTKNGNKFTISFDNVTGGLMVGKKTGLEPVVEVPGGTVKGFAIAGADGKFVWADGVIKGSTVEVSNSGISDPVYVRYSWASNPVGNLYNKSGLPMSPFRSDGAKSSGSITNPATPIPESTPTPQVKGLKGDLNGDESIDSTDSSIMKRYLLKIISSIPGDDRGDLNRDGAIDSTDFALLKRFILGIISKFPV